MKQCIARYLTICILTAAVCLTAACSGTPTALPTQSPEAQAGNSATPEQIAAFSAAMDDWLSGTNYGITEYTFNLNNQTVHIKLSAEALEKLTDQDREDIWETIVNILATTSNPTDDEGYIITYAIDT